MALTNRKDIRARIHKRIRRKLSGTAERPRLAVYFSNANVYAQVIDDATGTTIVSASTKEKGYGAGKANVEHASKVGAVLAERAIAKNISEVVFDRAGFIYHGKVKALADAAREKGLKF
ncbi:MAG: 50S ribosomal protein L18 [Prosthecobacter sp.]|jgi:large subunit ribosomal protein L18|uniref:50S ribosomal protein L18 n=1 Tax=Prosthecobacter sp. TaxID=1965333 RepID=UPI003902F13A